MDGSPGRIRSRS